MQNFIRTKRQRHFVRRFLTIGILFATVCQLQAQHYPAGSEGIKGASLPPPGFYFEDYNSFYFSNYRPGFGGQLKDLQRFYYTQTPRLIWMSDWKILGADYGASIRVPIKYLQVGTRPDSKFGLSDIEIQLVSLSWHLKHFDFSTGYSFWAPTGEYNKNNEIGSNLGNGYWTHSFSLGITWYPDADKTWAVSLLNHYDINTAQYSGLYVDPTPSGVATLDTTLGDIYTLEWAVSKTIVNGIDIGLTGYYQQQVTATEGPTPNGPTWNGEKIHVAGIGPEIRVALPEWGLLASLRYDYEFSAMDHPQGNLINLTVTKSF